MDSTFFSSSENICHKMLLEGTFTNAYFLFSVFFYMH